MAMDPSGADLNSEIIWSANQTWVSTLKAAAPEDKSKEVVNTLATTKQVRVAVHFIALVPVCNDSPILLKNSTQNITIRDIRQLLCSRKCLRAMLR